MTLYEINQAILDLYESAVDPETGEVGEGFDHMLDMLDMARGEKIENIGLWIKDLKAESEAIKMEMRKLQDRARAADNKAERLKNYLAYNLGGEKFSTPRVAISFRNTKAVEIEPDAWRFLPNKFLRAKDPEPDKKAIGDALKAGQLVPGCRLVENRSMTIK